MQEKETSQSNIKLDRYGTIFKWIREEYIDPYVLKNKIDEHLNNKSTWKYLWYKSNSPFRLEIEELDFKKGLLIHPKKNEPQAIQGMWQAYGPMRAARTTGRYTVVAASITATVLGIGAYIASRDKQADAKIMKMKETINNAKSLLDTNKETIKTLQKKVERYERDYIKYSHKYDSSYFFSKPRFISSQPVENNQSKDVNMPSNKV